MFAKFLESLSIGFSIAAIPGPIFFELVRRTLSQGLRSGIYLVLGEFSGNFVLLAAVFFGLSHILSSLAAKTILYVIGGLILIYIGFGAFRLTELDVDLSYDDKASSSKKESFLLGVSIAATSPIVIALWVSLSGSYLNTFTDQKYLALINVFLIAAGFLLFFIPLAYIIYKTRHRIPSRYVVTLSKVFGTILIAYGLLLMYQAVRLY